MEGKKGEKMRVLFGITCCIICFCMGLYVATPPPDYYKPPESVRVVKMLDISNGILVDPSLYLTAREEVRGEYILTIEDLEFITGIRIKRTGQELVFNESGWTQILSDIYFMNI